MRNRIVEITNQSAHLSLSRGFLCVSIEQKKAGQIAIEDMAALVIRGYGASFSVNVCTRLAEANIPIILCGNTQSPASIIWPIAGHFAQGLHMQAQAIANKPLLKRLWSQLIKAKIQAQAAVLESFSLTSDDLTLLSKRIKAGDPENREAQAAKRYWNRLMGKDFRRDRHKNGINARLNYGYTVLRAAIARAILSAGLHPSLSLHHKSRGDPFCLADDLMEPFRPWVDYQVRTFSEHAQFKSDQGLTPEIKQQLASILQMDFSTPVGASPMQTCMDKMAQSLVRIFMGEDKKLDLPGMPLPLTLSALSS